MSLGSMLAIAALALAGNTPIAPPKLSPGQALQLLAAGGFTYVDGKIHNRCGQVANPRIQFIDLDGDGVADAHIADVAPTCYSKPGAFYALVQRTADGGWHRLIVEDAIATISGARDGGWLRITVKPGNGSCPGERRFSGGNYMGGCAVRAAIGPVSPVTVADDPAADKASLIPLTATDRTAIFRAAGATPVGKGKWRMCTDDRKYGAAEIASARDVNGDGRPDAIVTESGVICYGNTGTGFAFVSQQASGQWKLMIESMGIPRFLMSNGHDGFPDIEIGGPGMCFADWRWNGQEYDVAGASNGAGERCTLP